MTMLLPHWLLEDTIEQVEDEDPEDQEKDCGEVIEFVLFFPSPMSVMLHQLHLVKL